MVVGNAISRGNPELESVLDRSLRYASLPETIREAFLWDADAIVIAGTHGKTTTTALTAWLLTRGGLDPSMLVGGIARNFGDGGASYRVGAGRAFVIEGDEYDSAYFDKTAKFLKYLPDIAVVNNVEFDHADIYQDLDAVRLAFARFVRLVPRRGLVLLGADSADAAALAGQAHCPVQTFGLGEGLDWRAQSLASSGTTTRFVLTGPGGLRGEITLPLLGAHNVRNALAAAAVAHACGLDLEAIATGLASFAGVKRRLEVVGTRRGVTDLRRLRASSDRRRRDRRGDARVAAAGAAVGDLRAAIGVIVPPRLPGGVRRGVRRRRPGADRPGVPECAGRRPAPERDRARRRSEGPRGRGALHRVDRRDRRHRRRRGARR